MHKQSLALLIILLLINITHSATSLCKEYIQAVTNSALQMNISKIPIATIMYSGITTNNPGQKYECQHKTPISDPYNYFLIGFKNTTNNVNTFTGLCVPSMCTKQDIEQVLIHQLNIKNIQVYDYPSETLNNGLLETCFVVVGVWVGVLALRSIWLSLKQPVQNEFIKKDEQIHKPNDKQQQHYNSLVEQKIQKKDDYKLFNFYQGYCRIFKRQTQKHIFGSILFLASFSLIFSTQFSYRQTLAANQVKSLQWFNSFAGVLICNIEIAYGVVMFVLGAKLAFSLYRLSSFHQIGRYFFDQLLMKWVGLVLATMSAYILLSFTEQPLNQLWKNNYGADCPSVMYQLWFLFRNLTMDCKVCLQWFWIMQVDMLLTIVSAPLFIIYRTKRWLGYGLFIVGILISIIFSYGILQDMNIVFQPYKLFNMAREYTINYQTNAMVRIAPYTVGIIVGLFASQNKETHDSGQIENQNVVIKVIRKNHTVQIILHLIGFALMLLNYLLIIPYLQPAQPKPTTPPPYPYIVSPYPYIVQPYPYIVFTPLGYLAGLSLMLLPCLLQGQSKLTVLLTQVLGAGIWNSLQRMAISFLWVGPVIIGFTTYSMQNSIYFDFQTVFVYFLGDCVIVYVVTLLAVSSIDSQLSTISRWMQAKVFGNQSKHSVVVIED